MQAAIRHFGAAVLGRDAYQSLSAERMTQVRENSSTAEFLSETFMLPVDPAAVRKCAMPTLLTIGQSSPVIWRRLAGHLHALLPVSQIVKIPGASHIMHEDNPVHFNTVVRTFLKNCTAR